MRHQRPHRRVVRLAGEGCCDLLAPPVQLGRCHAGIGDFVDDVVDLAAERIERGDRGAPRRRQEQEGVVEARAARGSAFLNILLAASRRFPRAASRMGVRNTNARQASSGASAQREARTFLQRAELARVRFSRGCADRPARRGAVPSRRARGRVAPAGRRAASIAAPRRPFQRSRRAVPEAIRAASRSSVRSTPCALQSALGHVETAAGSVDAEVLPEIRQLKRRADRVRCRRACRCRRRTGAAASDRSGSPNGGSSRAARRGRRSACFTTSCSKASSRSVEHRDRQVACRSSGPVRAERRPRASVRTAGCRRRSAPGRRGTRPRSASALCGARIAFVGDVVGGAGEAVDRRYGRSQRRRAQPATQPESSRSDRRPPARNCPR